MDIYSKLTYSVPWMKISSEKTQIMVIRAMGTMLKYGSEGAKYFVDNYVLPERISQQPISMVISAYP